MEKKLLDKNDPWYLSKHTNIPVFAGKEELQLDRVRSVYFLERAVRVLSTLSTENCSDSWTDTRNFGDIRISFAARLLLKLGSDVRLQ